jgi:Ca-activated chloride channel homolog
MRLPHAIIPLALVVACLVATSSPSVDAKPGPAQTTLPARMVILHVRVTDADGNAVTDVPQSGFQVTEDGIPKEIELFMNREIPLSYGLVIDSSGSMRSQFSQVIRAGQVIVASNKPGDETFIIRFVSSDKIETAQEPTSDKARLLNTLNQFYVEGGASAVVDAVYLSAQKLAEQKDAGGLRRRVLVLVTDGEDRSSFYKKETLFQMLAANDVQIFTIGLTQEVTQNRDKAIEFLTELGSETGGRTFFPSSALDIERISKQIINDIRTQYVIGYMPSGDSTKDFHKVLVSIAENPNQEKRVAITRVGYKNRRQ